MFLILPTSQYVNPFRRQPILPSLRIMHFGPLRIGKLTHSRCPREECARREKGARRELGFRRQQSFLFPPGGRRWTSSLHHVHPHHHLPRAAVRAGGRPSCASASRKGHRRQTRSKRSGSTGTTPSAAPTHPQSALAPAKSAAAPPCSCAAASPDFISLVSSLKSCLASQRPSPGGQHRGCHRLSPPLDASRISVVLRLPEACSVWAG
jgi:hypothetical protein